MSERDALIELASIMAAGYVLEGILRERIEDDDYITPRAFEMLRSLERSTKLIVYQKVLPLLKREMESDDFDLNTDANWQGACENDLRTILELAE